MKPTTGAVAKAVGWVTFLEIIRDRVLYNILLCALLLFGVGYLASRLSFIRPERIILDFGVSAVALSCAIIATFTGSGLLGKEFERRTIYVALSKPISRAQFILGKFYGLALILLVNWLLLSAVFLSILGFTATGSLDIILSGTLFVALFLALLQSVVIAAIAIVFSTFSTTSLSVIITIGFYLIGHNISDLRHVAVKAESDIGRFVLNACAAVLPNLEHFSLGTKVTYGLPITWNFMITSVIYGIFLTSFLLLVAGFLIRHREV